MAQAKRKDSCTTVNENTAYAKLPPGTKGYLTEKVQFALKTAKVSIDTKNNNVVKVLNQSTLSGAILIDEELAQYKWMYKAEVVFYMGNAAQVNFVPVPYLTQYTGQIDRRRSFNFFRSGSRRPDVIIVKHPATLWCGRAGKDLEGYSHPDNLLRVVEVKFPGDDLSRVQSEAYQKIAGGISKFTVLDISDCDDDTGKKRRAVEAQLAAQAAKASQAKPVPVRTQQPIKEKVFYERWLDAASASINSIEKSANDTAAYYTQQTKQFFKEHAPWVVESGKWVQQKGQQAWTYMNEKGQAVVTWTKQQLDAVAKKIEYYTDLTIDILKSINWAQVMVTTATVVVLGILIAGTFGLITIPAGLVAGFTALIGISTTTRIANT